MNRPTKTGKAVDFRRNRIPRLEGFPKPLKLAKGIHQFNELLMNLRIRNLLREAAVNYFKARLLSIGSTFSVI